MTSDPSKPTGTTHLMASNTPPGGGGSLPHHIAPSPPSASKTGVKRTYQASSTDDRASTSSNSPIQSFHPHPAAPSPPLTSSSSSAASSAFRNVSACNRCRLRKNRCDQRLPACTACEKAHVKCVGYDPITKREIPRSYVYYLESRVSYLEGLLGDNGIGYKAPEAYDADGRVSDPGMMSPTEGGGAGSGYGGGLGVNGSGGAGVVKREDGKDEKKQKEWERKQDDADKLNKLVSNIGMVSVQGASDPRYLGSTSGISFARVVFAAVKSSVSCSNSERGGVRPSKQLPANAAAIGGTSMRDSFFGLQTKPTFKQASFPDRELGMKLVTLYFEHANPQIPILHRGEFMELFDRAYASEDRQRTPRELYMLNIVFAIGAGIIFGEMEVRPEGKQVERLKKTDASPAMKKQKLSSQQYQPEEYHASAIVHLESFLGSSAATDRPDGFGGGLEELQAVLLLAGFALLRPVAPGLWYIIGVAVRLGVDLGLHYEDGTGIEGGEGDEVIPATSRDVAVNAIDENIQAATKIDSKERGRREWVRDLRRRLWWCVYSFDRLVSTCVGRPFGITDQVITTEFPSLLDDQYITKGGMLDPPQYDAPSYKHVAHHYFRLRLLQSEILQVLQYQQAQMARRMGTNAANEFMHTKLPSPFLQNFDSFRAWRRDIDRRLWEWKESAPTRQDTGVGFSHQFLELNYWQAVIMLYRQSLTVPAPLAGELSPTEDVSSPSIVSVEEREDEDDVFLKVAEAGQKVLRLYRQLHRVRLVNYTFLATHHLFMAGISFLYAVWHSPSVRSRLTLDNVDFTVLAATSVLGDLMEKCPPAEACRDAFERMSKATVQMCLSTTGFGSQAQQEQHQHRPSVQQRQSISSTSTEAGSYQSTLESQSHQQSHQQPRRPPPRFDMNLRDLFPEETLPNTSQPYSHPSIMTAFPNHPAPPPPRVKQEPVQSPTVNSNYGINSQINAGLGMDANPSAAGTMDMQSQGQYNTPSVYYNTSLYGSDFVGMPGMNFLEESNLGNGNGGGIDLGFGMGMDMDHDWSDGTGLDLFDGFFFGGTGM